VLLVSGATPAVDSRIARLVQVLPLSVLEVRTSPEASWALPW